MVKTLVQWAANRAKEASTWVGIGGFVALFNPVIGAAVGKYGMVVGPMVAGILIGASEKN